ncbi:hypothetical protein AB6A40_011390 [Gnathostoma spinigerum]|uniref:Major facilitator superfamily (MFS) profile domain-containing protein n=1 Tax=Gnathostoma spinigerum TaxID=75299 RepID=A0ABD6EXP1_9BILA
MNIVYWGLALFSTTLSEDGFTGFFLSALIEIPAAVVTVPLLKYFGRKTITFWVFIMLAFSMAAAIVYPGPGNFQMIFPIAAKLFNTIMWVTEPLLVTEMSPTSVRNIFYGIVQFFGGMGSVCAPYVGVLVGVMSYIVS